MFQFEVEENLVPESSASLTNRDDTEDLNQRFSIGDRIRCAKDSGVVRYIGPVQPHSGIWLGIEWDDPSRGKHSGSVDGVVYFESATHNAASFIRAHKAKKAKTIFQALNEKYGYDQAFIDTLKPIDNRLERMKIEYSTLKVLDLSAQEISEVGLPAELAELCPNIEVLNISDNLITSWTSIGSVCASLKRLLRLNISENQLVEPSDDEILSCKGSFETVDHMIVGKVNYDWPTIIKASEMWSQVTNLQVHYNNISFLSPPQTTLFNLTSLDLGGNKITSWDEVIKLNVLERLSSLNLLRNKIESIRFPVDPGKDVNCQVTSLLPSLSSLNLSENCIQDWISLSELNKLQGLKQLRIDQNPFLNNDVRANNRQLIIAKISKLQKLEGAEISRQERRDAEIDYLKLFASKWRLEGSDIRFAIEHPRYAEIAEKYGHSEEGETSISTKNMRCNLVSLQLVPDNVDLKPCVKKLMQSMTVQKLKMLLQRIFKTAGIPTEIKLVSSQNPGISFTLENDFFDLDQYSVEDGDTLFIRW